MSTKELWYRCILTVVGHLEIRDLLLLEVVLRDNIINLGDWIWIKLIRPHVDGGDVWVALQAVHKGSCIRLINIVARDVNRLNWLVHFYELAKRFTEHVAKLVRAQAKELKAWIVVQKIYAQFRAGFVVKSIQSKVQTNQRFVNLESLSKEARAIIRNAIIRQIQMGQNLSLQNVLGNLTGTRIGNFVVSQIKLRNSLV